jgi:hypothetical protein
MFSLSVHVARRDAILTHNLSEIVGIFNHTGKASPTPFVGKNYRGLITRSTSGETIRAGHGRNKEPDRFDSIRPCDDRATAPDGRDQN